MNKKNQALLKKFAHLRTEAAVVRKQDDSLRNATYKHFAQLYFWWLPAESTGILTGLYKKHAIQFKRPAGNSINFIPLIKLVWDKKVPTSFADRWSRALNEMHREVQAHLNHYDKDGVAKLAHWIKTEGGPSKLSGYFQEPDLDGVVAEAEEMTDGLAEREIFSLLLTEATSWYANQSGGVAGTSSSQPVKLKGFGLELFHNDGVSTRFVASWLNPAQIESAVIDCYRETLAALPPPLRFVAELIHLRSVPWSLVKVADKVRKSSLGGREWRDRFTLRSSMNDIVISPTKGVSGVVINAPLPLNLVLPFVNDLFLARYSVVAMERKLLWPRIFNLITQHGQGFQPVPQKNVATQYLRLAWKNRYLNSAVDFYPFLQLPSIHLCPFYKGGVKVNDQVQCDGFKASPTFRHVVSPQWLHKANIEFFDPWVMTYGAKANRMINMTLGLTFDSTCVRIDYEYFQSSGFNNQVTVDFDALGVGQASLIVRSTDFAFTLRQIADLTLTSDLEIEASAALICLRFSTAAGPYTCWIPSCNKDAVRSAIGFSKYIPKETP